MVKSLSPLRNHHFRPKKKPAEVRWNLVCANLSRRSCDLSEAQLLYLGKYVVRVRADAGGTHSEWVMLKFHPDEHGETPSGVKGQEGFRASSVCSSSQGGPPQQGDSVVHRKRCGRPHR